MPPEANQTVVVDTHNTTTAGLQHDLEATINLAAAKADLEEAKAKVAELAIKVSAFEEMAAAEAKGAAPDGGARTKGQITIMRASPCSLDVASQRLLEGEELSASAFSRAVRAMLERLPPHSDTPQNPRTFPLNFRGPPLAEELWLDACRHSALAELRATAEKGSSKTTLVSVQLQPHQETKKDMEGLHAGDMRTTS